MGSSPKDAVAPSWITHCGRRGHDAVGPVAGIELTADQTGDAQRRDDDQHQDDRYRIAAEGEAALGFCGLGGVLRRRLLKSRGGRILLGGRRVCRRVGG